MEAEIQQAGNHQNGAAQTSGAANAQVAAGKQERPGTNGPREHREPNGTRSENGAKRDGARGRNRHDRGRRDRSRSESNPLDESRSVSASGSRSEEGTKMGTPEAVRVNGRVASERPGDGRRDRQRVPRNAPGRDAQPPREKRLPDPARLIKKREETLEDIRADVDRVEKDIQFEIKQIQTVSLGL